MTDIRQKKENVKMQLKDLRQNLKKMHLTVTEELILPHPRFMNRNFVITPLSEILSRSQKIKKFDDPKWSIK